MKHLWGLLLPVFFICKLSAQDNLNTIIAQSEFKARQVISPAPEAAELGKYGNVPVSLFTGTPTISIPLVELKGKFLSLPLSLSFNASGFKPGDIAGWTGSGWSLNAGGVVTRSVMGNPDNESNYYGRNLTPPSSSDVFAYRDYLQQLSDQTLEAQPDAYFYNFAGHSGKFYIASSRAIIKKEQDMLRIQACTSCDPSYFTITDEQGIIYSFTEIEQTRLIPSDEEGSNPLQYSYPSAWYLSGMEAPGGERIEFEYYTSTSEEFLGQNLIANQSITHSYRPNTAIGTCPNNGVNGSERSNAMPPTTYIRRKFLKKITLKRNNTEVGYIDLGSATGLREDSYFSEDRMLQYIKMYSVSNGVTIPVKQYNFTFDYFVNSSNPGAEQKRLQLKSLQEIAPDGSGLSKPPYYFTYDTRKAIPRRFTAALDHWGYFNGSSNSSLLPYVDAREWLGVQINVGDGANREPDVEGASCTMLTKIQYPAGGYTSFEYELNQAKFNGGSIHDVGGIRIRQLIDYAPETGRALVKRYSYVLADGSTSGVAGRWPDYKKVTTSATFKPTLTCPSVGSTTRTTVTANAVFGLGSVMGSPMGYSRVKEETVDLNTNQSLGYKEYNYRVGDFWEHDDDINAGKLLREASYNNVGKLLLETVNDYKDTYEYVLDNISVKPASYQSDKRLYCKTSDGSYYNYGDWQDADPSCTLIRNYSTIYIGEQNSIKSQKVLPTKQTQKLYDQLTDSYVVQMKELAYENTSHNYPTRITQYASNSGELVITANKYSGDYTLPGASSAAIASHIQNMIGRNIKGLPIESVQYRVNADGSNKRVINGTITDYLYTNPLEVFRLETAAPLADLQLSSFDLNNGNFIKDNHYQPAGTFVYDGNYNLLSQYKTNDVRQSYIWNYQALYPVAEAINATENEIAYSGFEADGKGNLIYAGTPVQEASSPAGAYCYSLASGNIQASGLDPAKTYTVSYWSNAGAYAVSGNQGTIQGKSIGSWTLFSHKVSGVSGIAISGGGLIDEVRLHPANAQMNTYTYQPMIGLTDKADFNNLLIRYEYDALGRLLNIRDDNRSIVKNFNYNYGPGMAVTAAEPTLFYSATTQGDFTRNTGCPTNAYPQTTTYTVLYGKFISSTSQADADAKAAAELNSAGQNAANQLPCVYKNAAILKRFMKECDWATEGKGSMVAYDVPFGKYSAPTQAEADALAQADMDANGQAYANAHGYCICGTEGKKMVNGNCETGTKIYVGSTYTGGQYQCRYRYVFSDGSVSQDYYEYRSTPCPQSN